ncbi:MAG: transposase [Terriglobales bacterium]
MQMRLVATGPGFNECSAAVVFTMMSITFEFLRSGQSSLKVKPKSLTRPTLSLGGAISRFATLAHRAKKVSAFVQTLSGQLRLFFLPPYSQDRNTDELVWKHLKADTVGRMAVTSREDFTTKVRRSLRDLQNNARKIISLFQMPSLKYAA